MCTLLPQDNLSYPPQRSCWCGYIGFTLTARLFFKCHVMCYVLVFVVQLMKFMNYIGVDAGIFLVITYRKTSIISRTKFQNWNVSCPLLQLSLPNPLKPGVKLKMKMEFEQRRQAMLQLHLSYQQLYCLLRCDLYKRFYGKAKGNVYLLFPWAMSNILYELLK